MAIKISGTEVIDDNRNITTSIGTVDGRDVATDGTKLDGIETGANVTDATNVIAAGALMKTGGTMTGTLTVSGSAPQIKLNDTTAGADDFWIHANANNFYVLADRDDSGGYESPHPLTLSTLTNKGHLFGSEIISASGGTITGNLNASTTLYARDIRAYAGQHLVINAGESHHYATGQTSEFVYINAENGLQINSSPDNWVSGWAGRKTATICNADGNSSFPGNISASGTVDGRNVSADGTKLDGIEAGAKADQTFDQLLNKTSGTGEYSTNGHLASGRGSGGVAMTINDGYGNANLTFNHKSGVPEQVGNIARIASNTDDTSNPNMSFQLGTAVTAGVALAASEEMKLLSTGLNVTNNITLGGTVDGRDVATDGTKLDGIEAGAKADQVGLVKGADIGAGADLNTYTTDGYFHQNLNVNAGSGTNYPVAFAGMLSVQADGSMAYQKYQTYDGSGTYQRTKYNATWYAWDKILDTGNAVAVGSVGSYALLKQTVTRAARSPGATRSGSGLDYTSTGGNGSTTSPSGTWRIMGAIVSGTGLTTNTSLWLRIS